MTEREEKIIQIVCDQLCKVEKCEACPLESFFEAENERTKEKLAGYAVGYADGLHDGNPFIMIAESAHRLVESLAETLTKPEVLQAIAEAKNKEVK